MSQLKIDRRQFIKLSAAVAATGSRSVFAAPPTDRIKLAVKYSMIQGRMSVLEKFRMLKRSGFHGTEFKLKDKPQQKEILQAIDETGIVAHGVIHGDSDEYTEAIDFCKQLGGTSVLIVARERKDLSYAENFRLAQQFVRKAIGHAEKNNVRLLVENVRAGFLKKAEETARFIDELNSPVAGAYFDTGNAITWTRQSAEHWVRVLGKRIVKMDIKDRGHTEFGDPKTKRAGVVGTHGGEVNWAAVQRELRQLKFTGWATAEVKGGDAKRIHRMGAWMNEVLFAKESKTCEF